MQKLVVAFPMYRQIPVHWFFNFLKMDKEPLVGTVATEGIYLPTAMQNLVDMAFQNCPEWDRIVVFEHDMIPPEDAFTRIANYPDELDIVGTTYFKHDWPHHVMAWMQIDKPRFSPLTREYVKGLVDNPGIHPVDGVAMGFTSIHRRVFENWDPDIPIWAPLPPFVGHDLHFCNEALKQGFKIYLDSGIGCGHLTLRHIGYPDNQKALAERAPQTWDQFIAENPEIDIPGPPSNGAKGAEGNGSLGATATVLTEE